MLNRTKLTDHVMGNQCPSSFHACPSPPCLRSAQLSARKRPRPPPNPRKARSEEHTSELQSLRRISYADFCLKKKKSQDFSGTVQLFFLDLSETNVSDQVLSALTGLVFFFFF